MASIKNKNIFLFFMAIFFCLPFFASASITNGTIDSVYKYAWSNNIGWINFAPMGDNATYKGLVVTDSSITGYAWSKEHGWINFGPFVNNTQGGVKNTADGVLSGYAWGQELGWINFSGVSINSSGQFTGEATGDSVGIINFDLTKCTDCGVKTDWRPVSVRPVASSGHGGHPPLVVSQPVVLPPSNVIPNTQPPVLNPPFVQPPTVEPVNPPTASQNNGSSAPSPVEKPESGQILNPKTNIPVKQSVPVEKNIIKTKISQIQKLSSSFFGRMSNIVHSSYDWIMKIIKSISSFFAKIF
jgi:hypothetical protein